MLARNNRVVIDRKWRCYPSRRLGSNFLGVTDWKERRLPSTMAAPAEAATPAKDHKSALCLIPPRTVWNEIQEIRCFHDKGFCRWPPHINLLYPFLADSGNVLESAAAKAAHALTKFRRFDVELRNLRHFTHGAKSATVWLQPSSSVLLDLQKALLETFPQCSDLNHDPSRGIMAFVPHLGLGQWGGEQQAQRAIQELSKIWKPTSFQAWEVAIITRAGFDAPFSVRYSIGIGNSNVEKVDVPYISTVGEGPTYTEENSHLRFGIGAMNEGVWNFAYGANVNQEKLVIKRGITPFESTPGVLPGFRLAFNHRGGMGNVVPLSEPVPENGYPHDLHGVLHRLRPVDFIKLSNMEHAYRPVEMIVQPYDGHRPIRAAVFVTPQERETVDGLDPPDRYVNLISIGAREWRLDDSYVSWLENLKTVTPEGRTQPYWQKKNGDHLPDWPVIRIGAQEHRAAGRGPGRGRQGKSKRKA